MKERFDAWWKSITRQGDPQRRLNLPFDAFEAGWNAGRAAMYSDLSREFLQRAQPDPDGDLAAEIKATL